MQGSDKIIRNCTIVEAQGRALSLSKLHTSLTSKCQLLLWGVAFWSACADLVRWATGHCLETALCVQGPTLLEIH